MKLGILKETKIPIDHRVPLTPTQADHLQKNNSYEVFIESSDQRCFVDSEYIDAGIKVVDDVTDCDILLGVKEVSIENLIKNKTYLFFSHTIKKQPHNRDLLKSILDNNIKLIDYECLTDNDGRRLVAFGRYAGIVGAYNGIWTFGKRYHLFDIRRAYECYDLADLKTEFTTIQLPPINIVITGGGRVAKGAMETLMGMNIRKVSPNVFLNERLSVPVFTQLNPRDYNKSKEAVDFSLKEFYNRPDKYDSDFQKFYQRADILIAAAYWDPSAPILFTREQMLENDFKLKVIADITCDLDGSIPSTLKASTIEDPIYDYNAEEGMIKPPLSDEENVTIMAVDNLPCELPRNASDDFGHQLETFVLPNFINGDMGKILERAAITDQGALTERFSYLDTFVNGK